MAFVPEARGVEYFNVLSENLSECTRRSKQLCDHMAETYIGLEVYERVDGDDDDLVLRIRRQPTWRRPKFSPKLWSVY